MVWGANSLVERLETDMATSRGVAWQCSRLRAGLALRSVGNWHQLLAWEHPCVVHARSSRINRRGRAIRHSHARHAAALGTHPCGRIQALRILRDHARKAAPGARGARDEFLRLPP